MPGVSEDESSVALASASFTAAEPRRPTAQLNILAPTWVRGGGAGGGPDGWGVDRGGSRQGGGAGGLVGGE